MTTEAQLLANRLNAQKSTGPKTPQGKAVVSQNALKHGLSARHDVITTETQADFDLHREALLDELAPQGPMESMLADRIVSLSWRLKRADLIQNQTFDAMNEKNTNNPLANLAKSFGLKGLGFPQDETSDPHPDLTLGRIALKDFSNERVLDRLLMYERRIEHSLYKTILEIQRLHLLRDIEPSEPNLEPVRATPCGRPDPPQGRPDPNLEPENCCLAPGPVPGGAPQNQTTPPNRAKTIQHQPSSIEYRVSRIHHHYAKQTQFPQTKKQPQPLQPQRITSKNHPHPTQENKPNQTQIHPGEAGTKPIYRGKAYGEAGTNPIKPNTDPQPYCRLWRHLLLACYSFVDVSQYLLFDLLDSWCVG